MPPYQEAEVADDVISCVVLSCHVASGRVDRDISVVISVIIILPVSFCSDIWYCNILTYYLGNILAYYLDN